MSVCLYVCVCVCVCTYGMYQPATGTLLLMDSPREFTNGATATCDATRGYFSLSGCAPRARNFPDGTAIVGGGSEASGCTATLVGPESIQTYQLATTCEVLCSSACQYTTSSVLPACVLPCPVLLDGASPLFIGVGVCRASTCTTRGGRACTCCVGVKDDGVMILQIRIRFNNTGSDLLWTTRLAASMVEPATGNSP